MNDGPYALNERSQRSFDLWMTERVAREILADISDQKDSASLAGCRRRPAIVRRLTNSFVAILSLISAAAQAQVTESFDYPPGALSRRNGGTGWNGPWHIESPQHGGSWSVGKEGLDHAGLQKVAGSSALCRVQGSRYQRNFAQPFRSGVVYLSFLTKSSNRSGDPYSAVELQLKGSGEAFRIFQLGLLRNDDGNPNGGDESAFYARSRASVGGGGGDTAYLEKFNTDVNLFVVRFDLDACMAAVFVNPRTGDDLTGSGDGELTLFPKFSFDRVCIANFAGANEFVVDELRLAETPPPLSPAAKIEMIIDADGGKDGHSTYWRRR
jgi:hypothetical protein